MAIDSTQLLRRLEPAVRPGAALRGGAPAPASLEHASFGELLSLVSKGELTSGRPLGVDAGVASDEPFDRGQLERLAAAADLVEAAGKERALMLIDGRAVVLDVGSRRLVSELAPAAPTEVVALDAAVFVAGDDDEVVGDLKAPLVPGSGLLPPAVARQLDEALSRAGYSRDASTPPSPATAGHQHED